MIVEKVFGEELNKINSKEIRSFVVACFTKLCPDYFWVIPASSSGKYHPLFALGEGGLIRHVKIACWWGEELLRCWPSVPDTAHDEVMAALLLHDILKHGETEDEAAFANHAQAVAGHGVYLWNKIREEFPEVKTDPRLKRILVAIRDHMGKWTQDWEGPSAEKIVENIENGHIVCLTVHLADYCASRKLDAAVNNLY